MSRVKDLIDKMDTYNQKGGMPKEEWYMFLLTDIALSMATIADELMEGNEE